VFVVSSVAGGTGCGTLLDTGFLLCDISRHVHQIGEMFAYVFLPNVYYRDVRAGELAPRSYANAYAALKEADHYTKRIPQQHGQGSDRSDFIVEWKPNDRKKIVGPPFDATYLLEMVNEVSEAAKKGTSLAVEREPGVGLRSGLRWAAERGRKLTASPLRPDCPRF
jgi:hypothetical protein